MEPTPRVSVVIPAYNPGHYLRAALESVLGQTEQDWECVVVDDGSDEDLSWVTGVDPRIRLVRQVNMGLPAARNAGVRNSQGPLIAFLDSDDLWLPTKLEKQVAAMTEGVSMSATAFSRFSEEGRIPGWSPKSETLGQLLRGNDICASSTMVRRDAFEQAGWFDESLRSVEDWDMWLRLARIGRISGLQEELTAYRVHSGQMSNKILKMWGWSLRVLAKQRGPLVPTLAGVRRMGVVYGAQMFDQFRETRSVKDLWWSFAMWPDYVAMEFMRRPQRIMRSMSKRRGGQQ